MVQDRYVSADCTMDHSEKKQQFQSRYPLKLYVTSTPEDFDAERKFLAENIFPQLKELCLSRSSNFCPVDVRWKPEDEQVSSGHFLRFVLDAISKCSPFFISLIGQRYGPYRPLESLQLPQNLPIVQDCACWLDKNFVVAASAGYKWLLDDTHQHCSISELEILQAAFRCDNDYCHFYFRHSDHLDSKLANVTLEEQEKLCAIFLVENEYADLQVRDLKQRIVNKGLRVKYFQTLSELGTFVLSDWTNVIDLLYPPLINAGKLLATEEYSEWMNHETFACSRRRFVVSTTELQSVCRQVNEFVYAALEEPTLLPEEDHSDYIPLSMTSMLRHKKTVEARYKSVLVVTGDRGVGKSTLITEWYQSFTEKCPDVVTIVHHVGASATSIDISMFMRRCIQKLREEYLYADGEKRDMEAEQPSTFRELSEVFVASVSLGPCVLILDGVDELGSTTNLSPQEVKNFSWLPFPLPQEFCLICTTCRSDLSFHALVRRADAHILSVPSLNGDESRLSFLRQTMQNKFDLVNKSHRRQVLDIRLSTRPLFLNILRTEMQAFNVYTSMTKFLDVCLETCSSVRDLCEKCIQRWITDYNWVCPSDSGTGADKNLVSAQTDYIGWVPDVLRLLAVSRGGLTEENIFRLLNRLGYSGHFHVQQFSWLLFKESLGDFIYEKNNGQIIYSHQHLKEIVEYILLRSVKPASAEILTATEQAKFWKDQKKTYHSHLASHFSKQPFSKQKLDELPWQLLMSTDVDALCKLLTDPEMVMEFLSDDQSSRKHEFAYYWSILKEWGINPVIVYKQMLADLGLSKDNNKTVCDEDDGQKTCWATKTLHTFKAFVPKIFASPATDTDLSLSEAVTQCIDVDDLTKLADSERETSKNGNAVTSEDLDDFETIFITENKSDFKNGFIDLVKTETTTGTAEATQVAWLIQKFFKESGHLSEAEMILQAISDYIHKSYPLSDENRVLCARVQEELGSYCLARGEIDLAENWFHKSLSVLTDMIDVQESEVYPESDVYPECESLKGKLLSHFGGLRLQDGLVDDAEELLKEALGYRTNLTVKATILYTLGLIRLQHNEFLRAETTLRQALNLRERWFGKSHPLVADIIFSLAGLIGNSLNDLGYDRLVSEKLYRQSAQIRETCLGKEHLLLATTLFELGKLLKNDRGYQKKTEAVNVLRRSLDIRTTQLGGDHIDTRAVRSYLNKLEVTLKMGQYDIATMKVIPRDTRSQDQPFSSLSWRDDDLSNFSQKQKSCTARNRTSTGRGSRPHSVKQDTQSQNGVSTSRLSSASFMSASERLLAENQHTRLLNRGKVTHRLKHDDRSRMCEQMLNSTELNMASHRHREYLDNVVSPQKFSDISPTRQIDNSSENVPNQLQYIEPQVSFQNQQTFPSPASSELILFDQSQYLNSVSADSEIFDTNKVTMPSPPKRQLTIEIPIGDILKTDINSTDMKPVGNRTNKEQSTVKPSVSPPVRTRNESGPLQLFNRYGSSVGSRTGMSSGLTSVRNLSARRGSARSSMSAGTLCSVRSHQSYCDIPGAHTIHKSNSRTVTMGPNCSVNSLLGPAPCPRNVSQDIHHKSAWYHVPGRYTIPEKIYPRKRSQRSPGVKLMETSLMVNGVQVGGGESPCTAEVSQNNCRVSSPQSQRFPPSVREIWAKSQMVKHHGIPPATTVVTFKDPVTFS